MPAVEALRPEVALRIAQLAEAGLPVLFTGVPPRRSEGMEGRAANDAIVKTAMARTLSAGARVVPETSLAASLTALDIPPNLRFLSDSTDFSFVERKAGKRGIYFIRNRGGAPASPIS